MKSIEILTYSGDRKVIRGHQRALMLRKEVREEFEKARRKDAFNSFTGHCQTVAEKLCLTTSRVMQIIKNDFEFENN